MKNTEINIQPKQFEKIVPLRTNQYKIVVRQSLYSPNKIVWQAFIMRDGWWQEVPMWTENDEKKFPKTLAKIGHAFWEECTTKFYAI